MFQVNIICRLSNSFVSDNYCWTHRDVVELVEPGYLTTDTLDIGIERYRKVNKGVERYRKVKKSKER